MTHCPLAQEYCTSRGFQERARDFFESTLGFSIQSDTARWIGIPGALRGAEAIDSIQNFVDSAQAGEGDWVVGHIICGIVELGGVVYVLIVLIVLSLAIPLAQAVNFFVGILYDAVIILMAASRSTEQEIETAMEAVSGGGGGGGGGGVSAKVQRAREAKNMEDKKNEKMQTKRLASVFSRSRNKRTSGPTELPNKPPTELTTQRDVDLAVASLRIAVAGLTTKDELKNRDQFQLLTRTLYDMRIIRYEGLRSYTINELAKIKLELERIRDIQVGALEDYTIRSIVEVRGLIEQLQEQNGGAGCASGAGGAVLSRRIPSTNSLDASAARSGVFGALATRAQTWLASRGRVAYDEVIPASEDDEYNDQTDDATSDTARALSTVAHHVSDTGDVGRTTRHGPSPSELRSMGRFAGILPPV